MILSRLAEAARTQNWFTVVVEIIVVVVGIFIGLQADDWNQRRLDRNDEQVFLNRLHEELLDAISVRAFLRDRRIEDWNGLRSGLDSVFQFDDRDSLTDIECRAIFNSHIKSANIAELPSFRTLLATGRLHIISDEELRAMFVQFSQRRETIERFVDLDSVQLSSGFPELFDIKPFVNTAEDRNDLDVSVTCNLDAMRQTPKFLMKFYENADLYDSYIVSGLLPIVETVHSLHELLDRNLELNHD
ncbi:MAG: hypothetical protein OEM50_01590 [Gammaproteobacteria bacterium]|nr:hypothetical protein [Gammaproteobacteria bacterium]MDH3480379.1 hypothetical protein [Gammaproteobacteria bacterium]